MNIIICTNCNGEGIVTQSDHRNFRTDITCSTCNGTGRLKEWEFQMTVAFDYDEHLWNKQITEVFELIRGYKK